MRVLHERALRVERAERGVADRARDRIAGALRAEPYFDFGRVRAAIRDAVPDAGAAV